MYPVAYDLTVGVGSWDNCDMSSWYDANLLYHLIYITGLKTSDSL